MRPRLKREKHRHCHSCTETITDNHYMVKTTIRECYGKEVSTEHRYFCNPCWDEHEAKPVGFTNRK